LNDSNSRGTRQPANWLAAWPLAAKPDLLAEFVHIEQTTLQTNGLNAAKQLSVLSKVLPDLVPKYTIGFQVRPFHVTTGSTGKPVTSINSATSSPIQLDCGYMTQSQKGVHQEWQEVLNIESAKNTCIIDATASCRFPLAKLPLNLDVHFLDNASCEHMETHESSTSHSTHNAGEKNSQFNKTNLASTVVQEQEGLCMKSVKVDTAKAAAGTIVFCGTSSV
jgi:hypothetical protein